MEDDGACVCVVYGRRPLRIDALHAFYTHIHTHQQLLLRLMYLPIAFKNYGLSLLPGCPFPIFALCTLAASVPYTLLWAHMGASSRSLLDLLSGHHGKGGLLWVRCDLMQCVSVLDHLSALINSVTTVIDHYRRLAWWRAASSSPSCWRFCCGTTRSR